MEGSVTFVTDWPPQIYEEHRGFLAVGFWMTDTEEVRAGLRSVIDLYIDDGGLDTPHVIVVDQKHASVVYFDRARAAPPQEET